jgi:hypothetical protein
MHRINLPKALKGHVINRHVRRHMYRTVLPANCNGRRIIIPGFMQMHSKMKIVIYGWLIAVKFVLSLFVSPAFKGRITYSRHWPLSGHPEHEKPRN